MSRSVSHGYCKVSEGDLVNYYDSSVRSYLAEVLEQDGRKYVIKILSSMEIIKVRRRDFKVNRQATLNKSRFVKRSFL